MGSLSEDNLLPVSVNHKGDGADRFFLVDFHIGINYLRVGGHLLEVGDKLFNGHLAP